MKSKTPMILQTEAAECGLACLAMVLGYHGYETDLTQLRKKHTVSMEGMSVQELMAISTTMGLEPRPVSLDLEDLHELILPAIVHWDMNHFCVVSKVKKGFVTVLDPGMGERILPFEEFGNHFTGIALELFPTANFEKKKEKITIPLQDLFGRVGNLKFHGLQLVMLTVAAQIMGLLAPFFSQLVIDEVVVTADYQLLTLLVVTFTVVLIFGNVISLAQQWISIYLSSKLSMITGINVFRHLIFLPTSYFHKRHIGDIISRFEGVDKIKDFIINDAVSIFVALFVVVFSLGFLLVYSPMLCGFVVFFTLLRVVLSYFQYKETYRLSQSLVVAKSSEDSHFMETLRGIETIKLYNHEQQRKAKWFTLFSETISLSVGIQKKSIVYDFFFESIDDIENIILYSLGAYLVISGSFTVGMLMAFISYRGMFNGSFDTVREGIAEYKMLNIERDRVADILLEKSEQPEQTNTKPYTGPGKIALEDVEFRYSDLGDLTVQAASLIIEPGDNIAITGPSGTGKTTLLKLMLGLLEPTKGQITLDGTSVQEFGLRRYRSLVASVMQDDTLFSGSILENITLFANSYELEDVERAAKLAHIHTEIEDFGMGYQTLVGDMGTTLSGGQKQRVLLARALYKNPKIMIMDEATSALDAGLEKQIGETLKGLDITRIAVAHRKETIMMADKQYYFDGVSFRRIKKM